MANTNEEGNAEATREQSNQSSFGRIAQLGYVVNRWARKSTIFFGATPTNTARHPRTTYLLGMAVWLVLLLGPSFWYIAEADTHRHWSIYLGAVVGIVFLALPRRFPTYRLRKTAPQRDLLFTLHGAIAFGMGAYFLSGWIPGVSEFTANSGYVYRHVYMLAIAVLFLSLVFHRIFCVRSHTKIPDFNKLASRLKDADLMVEVKTPSNTVAKHYVRVLVKAPTDHWYLYLVLNALAVVLFAIWLPTWPSWWVLFGSAAAWWIVLSFSFYHRHWDLVAEMALRLFALGTPGVVSLFVIVLGAGQLFGVDYITTIIDGSPIKSLLASAYAMVWLYEYWLNRMFFAELTAMLIRNGKKTPIGDLPCTSAKNLNELNDRTLGRKAHSVKLLGANRFHVTGKDPDEQKETLSDRVFTASSFLDELIRPSEQAGQASQNSGVSEKARLAHTDTKKSIDAYFLLSNALLAVFVVGGFVFGYMFPSTPRSALVLESSGCKGKDVDGKNCGVKLGALINSKSKPMLVALSGGGTRAALHGASFLCGLSKLGKLDQVVLISSVSGGSAANAYFAMHRKALLKPVCELTKWPPDDDATPWARFYRTMSANFISDVMLGVVERRVFADTQNGQLLAESFQRRFPCNGECAEERIITTDDQTELGLIFNTTITGHPATSSSVLSRLFGDKKAKSEHTAIGGRLVFTNLRKFVPYKQLVNDINCEQPSVGERCLAYKIIDGKWRETEGVQKGHNGVRLAYAAAASANFPPVFSDSGVRAEGQQYWVTDGGALDNRGAFSLFLALELDDDTKLEKRPLIVVVDASATSIDYNPTRGISAGLSASRHVMNQLLESKLDRLFLGQRPQFYDIVMPTVIGARGGLGTHWKMQSETIFADPTEPEADEALEISLSKDEVLDLILSLYSPGECKKRIKADETLKKWICAGYGKDGNAADAWWALQQTLRNVTGARKAGSG